MKRSNRLALLAAAAVLALLFALKLWDSLAEARRPGQEGFFAPEGMNQSSAPARKANYASEKVMVPQGSAQQVFDQKYERVADLDAVTRDFEADARRLREISAKAGAVIQRENARGLAGSRVLSLTLGVVPATFDATVESLRSVGKLVSIRSSKSDRTADFKALEAKRLSLEKTRDGLKALRRTGAALSDLVALESKILEIEGQIQELGVSLGDFSETNSFCTIDARLSETASSGASAFLSAALGALGWAVLVELGLASIALAAVGAASLGTRAYARLRDSRAAGPGA
jgi:hypothetical protein